VGCGHFIQKDSPAFVSDELVSLLDRVVNRVDQVKEHDANETLQEQQRYQHVNSVWSFPEKFRG
jgi:hypothetical protein